MAQIATITVETAVGPVDLPVYEPGDSGANRLEAFRVQTASGPGFVPLAAVDEADRPYLRVQTSSGVRAVDTSASGIPDSVVSRPNDDRTFSNSIKFGVRIETSQEWPDIGARISANPSGYTTAYVYDVSDGTLMGSTDISTLSPGDTFTFGLDISLSAGGTYNVVVDAGGASMQHGSLNEGVYPYTSSDGNLQIVDGAEGETGTPSGIEAIDLVDVGNVGFD